jgi:DNA-binding beta-propeller fold protein YncE
VWVASEADGVVLRFDPSRRRFTARIEVGEPGSAIDLATTTDTVWVRSGDSLAGIDPQSNEVVERFGAPEGPSGIAVGPDGVWIGNRDGSVWRLDRP